MLKYVIAAVISIVLLLAGFLKHYYDKSLRLEDSVAILEENIATVSSDSVKKIKELQYEYDKFKTLSVLVEAPIGDGKRCVNDSYAYELCKLTATDNSSCSQVYHSRNPGYQCLSEQQLMKWVSELLKRFAVMRDDLLAICNSEEVHDGRFELNAAD